MNRVSPRILFVISLLYLPITNGLLFNYFYRTATSFTENEFCQNPANGTKYAIITHGWRESCDSGWTIELVKNLEKYRGGCVICMDYKAAAAIPHYFMLAKHVDRIAVVLKDKLVELENRGFNPRNGYIFGFSLGGRIAVGAGIMYGKRRISEIDVCDMAGPGFDFFTKVKSTDAAKNVQCIHTSSDKGTKFRDCHQNWNMGYCGMSQIGAGIWPGSLQSHGLCPRFYNAAFEHDFLAEEDPKQCSVVDSIEPFWPDQYKMGYMERRKKLVLGQLYASTTERHPYTENKHRRRIKDVIKLISGQIMLIIEKGNELIVFYKNRN